MVDFMVDVFAEIADFFINFWSDKIIKMKIYPQKIGSGMIRDGAVDNFLKWQAKCEKRM